LRLGWNSLLRTPYHAPYIPIGNRCKRQTAYTQVLGEQFKNSKIMACYMVNVHGTCKLFLSRRLVCTGGHFVTLFPFLCMLTAKKHHCRRSCAGVLWKLRFD